MCLGVTVVEVGGDLITDLDRLGKPLMETQGGRERRPEAVRTATSPAGATAASKCGAQPGWPALNTARPRSSNTPAVTSGDGGSASARRR